MRTLSDNEINQTAGGPAPLAAALLLGAARVVVTRVAQQTGGAFGGGVAEGFVIGSTSSYLAHLMSDMP